MDLPAARSDEPGAGTRPSAPRGLRSVPRTATVVAASDVRLLALDRSEFLVAATGAPDARTASDALDAERLAGQRLVSSADAVGMGDSRG